MAAAAAAAADSDSERSKGSGRVKSKKKDEVELLASVVCEIDNDDDNDWKEIPTLDSLGDAKKVLIGVPGERYCLDIMLKNPLAKCYHASVTIDGQSFDPIKLNDENGYNEIVDVVGLGDDSFELKFGNSIATEILENERQKPVKSLKELKAVGTIKIELGSCTRYCRVEKKNLTTVVANQNPKQPVLPSIKKAKDVSASSTVFVQTEPLLFDEQEIFNHRIAKKPLRSTILYYDSPTGLALKKRFDEKNPIHLELLEKYGLLEDRSSDSKISGSSDISAAKPAAVSSSSAAAAAEGAAYHAAQKAKESICLARLKKATDLATDLARDLERQKEDDKTRVDREKVLAELNAQQQNINKAKAEADLMERAILAQHAADQLKVQQLQKELDEKAVQFAATKLKIQQQQKELDEKSAARLAAHLLEDAKVAKKRVKLEPEDYKPSKKTRYEADLTQDDECEGNVTWKVYPADASVTDTIIDLE